MSKELEDTQGLSLEELELEGIKEETVPEEASSPSTSNLAEPVNAADVADLQSDQSPS